MSTMAEGGEPGVDTTADIPEDVLEVIKGCADLGLTVEPELKKRSFPTLPITATEFEHLDDVEEQKVKNWHFDEELQFSVPVNLRDSKRAYLALLNDEPESEADDDVLQSWGLDSLYKGPPSPSKDDKEDASKADA